MDRYLLGIDIGTTDIKAVLFNLEGEEIESVHCKNQVIILENGCAEQDMNLLWQNTCKTIQELLKKNIIDAESIVAIGFSAQGEGCWLADEQGQPVRSAILWNDVRSAYLINEMDEKFSTEHKRITGSAPGPGGTNFILKWLSINDAQSLAQAKYCFFCKDWIRFKLTGQASVEKSDMSTSLLDLKTGEVSTEMFNLLGISQYQSLIPPLISSYEIAGYISKEAANLTSLKEGTPVSAGYIDVVATGIGIGAIHENEACTILGTSCINEYVSHSFNTFEGSASYLFHGDGTNYFCLIGTMAGTPNIDWVNGTFFEDVRSLLGDGGKRYVFLDEKINAVPLGSGGIIFHPYIKTSGERAPFLDINARADLWGLSEHTTRWHILRAVYEGLAFSIKDCFQKYKPSRIFLAGGGSNSSALTQIVADCMGVPVVVSHSKELGAKGAALSAGIASGIFSSLKDGVYAFRSQTIEYLPNLANTEFYKEYFHLYQELRLCYKKMWKERKDILEKFKLKEGVTL